MTSPISKRYNQIVIDFPDTGDRWCIRSALTVGLDREFATIGLASQEIKSVSDPAVLVLAERTDRLLLACTTEWSYGPIDLDTLHNQVPASHYNEVGRQMVARYTPLVLERIENLLNVSSSPSNPAANGPSPTSSPTPS